MFSACMNDPTEWEKLVQERGVGLERHPGVGEGSDAQGEGLV